VAEYLQPAHDRPDLGNPRSADNTHAPGHDQSASPNPVDSQHAFGNGQLVQPFSRSRSKKTKRPHVALLVDMSSAYGRGLLQGIYTYVREHSPWSTSLTELGRSDPAPKWLIDNLHVDGVIARIENKRTANALLKLKIPVVNVSSAMHIPQFPWIVPDHAAISQLAAEHFLQRGFKNLAFCGNELYRFSNWREKEFVRNAQEAGCSCSAFHPRRHRRRDNLTLSEEQQQMGEWIQQLPKPVGIMACNDIRAQQLLETCERINISVPEEVSAIGVDNDEILCSWTIPPLSSVSPDSHRAGYEAARVLHALMTKKAIRKREFRFAPLGIITRQSSDMLAIDDPHVARAMTIIRARACEGINVADLLKEIPVSRRILERRFATALGRTPHEEILRLQIQKVVRLLKETSLPVTEVAHQSGFLHSEYLSVVFKKRFGVSPSQYRHKNRDSF
jgi:LacI family transcriptional regulator